MNSTKIEGRLDFDFSESSDSEVEDTLESINVVTTGGGSLDENEEEVEYFGAKQSVSATVLPVLDPSVSINALASLIQEIPVRSTSPGNNESTENVSGKVRIPLASFLSTCL
jgi:hypothetical protein